jgi:hypothetical protein
MHRRQVLQVIGGGVIVAAGAAGCSSGHPAQAIAAWEGPGAEPDLRRWVLAYALLAPHSHNLQSWSVDLRTPGQITLYCDPARLLPQTDPFNRQIMMSHGTFLEMLDLAARERGHRAELTLFPEGEFGPAAIDARPVARIVLVPEPGVARDPLFAQILRRRTNREAYDIARPVPADAWAAMGAAAALQGGTFGHADAEPALQRHRDIAARAWQIELTTPRAMLETFAVLRVGAAEIARHRDGLSLTDPVVVAMTKLGLFDRTQAPAPDSYATTSQIEDFGAKLASTPAFLWMLTEANDRRAQVNAGRAYARVQLAATAHGLAMQPLQQALQEYPEQAGPHAEARAMLGAAGSVTVQMWARVGHAPAVQPAPRRALDDIIRR